MNPEPLPAEPTAVDVSETLERKLKALEAQQSQVGDWDVRSLVTARRAQRGAPHGLACAETFRVITYRRPVVHPTETRPS